MWPQDSDPALNTDDRIGAVEVLVAAAAALEGAADLLDRALELAEQDEILAPFLSQPAVVRPLLSVLETRRDTLSRPDLRRRLMGLLGVDDRSPRPRESWSFETAVGLTGRESAVLRLMRGPLLNSEIASALQISPNTMKSHVRHIYAKLGVTSRQQARHRVLDLEKG